MKDVESIQDEISGSCNVENECFVKRCMKRKGKSDCRQHYEVGFNADDWRMQVLDLSGDGLPGLSGYPLSGVPTP